MGMTNIHLACISAMIIALLYLPYLNGSIDTASTNNLRLISINEDRFYNYDFLHSMLAITT
ncbi:MAG: hypothetical protein QXY85_03420 [Candidatus Nitrosocaldus sp.]